MTFGQREKIYIPNKDNTYNQILYGKNLNDLEKVNQKVVSHSQA